MFRHRRMLEDEQGAAMVEPLDVAAICAPPTMALSTTKGTARLAPLRAVARRFARVTQTPLLILLVIFSILKLPLKAIRYSCYYHGGCGPGYYYRPGLHLWNTFVGLAFLVFVLWLLNSHSEHAHEAIEHVRAATHHVVDALRDWWNQPSPAP